MKVFYQCYGRAHTSVVAAHIHLGRLRAADLPSAKEIMALPYFDQAEETDFGRPLLFGQDENGHEIYAVGLGLASRPCLAAITSVARQAGAEPPLVVNTLNGLGLLARIGGGISRELGWVALGRPLVADGVRRLVPRLARTVESVKRFLESSGNLSG